MIDCVIEMLLHNYLEMYFNFARRCLLFLGVARAFFVILLLQFASRTLAPGFAGLLLLLFLLFCCLLLYVRNLCLYVFLCFYICSMFLYVFRLFFICVLYVFICFYMFCTSCWCRLLTLVRGLGEGNIYKT
jgi:hypothetical protein